MYNKNDFSNKTYKLFREITDVIRATGEPEDLVKLTLSAYLLCLQMQSTYNDLFSYIDLIEENDFVPAEIKPLVREYLKEEEWDNLKRLIGDYSFDDALPIAFVLSQASKISGDLETPQSVITLSERLLNLNSEDVALDLCCGTGSFAVDALCNTPLQQIDAVDINTCAMDVLTIRSKLMDKTVRLIRNNAFSFSDGTKYHKIFANYPFMVKAMKDETTVKEFLETDKYPLATSRSSDWIFNALVMTLLREDGKAVVIMTNGSTYNLPDVAWRKFFVEHGFIEKIIALPPALFSLTSIPTTLLVLSYGNEKIRMIDATKIYHSQRRDNYLNDADIALILQSLDKDSSMALSVSKADIRDKEYDLFPAKYLARTISFNNEVKFGSVIKDIRLGTKMPAQKTAELITDRDTGCYYLQMNAIQNGIVDTELPKVKRLDEKLLKHCGKVGDMVFPKNYAPGKIAVLDCKKDELYLIPSNMYVLELDSNIVNPYYVAAFFDSAIGREILTGSRSGTTIPIIGVSALKELPFPLPDMEVQRKVANKYLAAMDEVRIYRTKLERATEKLSLAFGEEGEYLA